MVPPEVAVVDATVEFPVVEVMTTELEVPVPEADDPVAVDVALKPAQAASPALWT
jgi:hypothetical protein